MANLYKKKPIAVEAFRLGHEPYPAWFQAQLTSGKSMVKEALDGTAVRADIGTLEGDHRVDHGDWVIQGVRGELYPIKHDIFIETYEPA